MTDQEKLDQLADKFIAASKKEDALEIELLKAERARARARKAAKKHVSQMFGPAPEGSSRWGHDRRCDDAVRKAIDGASQRWRDAHGASEGATTTTPTEGN